MQTNAALDVPPFSLSFAVPLSCSSCIEEVTRALKAVPGCNAVDASLSQQSITTTGAAAPSALLAAINSTGRDAILRGASAISADGKQTPTTAAAVAILESYDFSNKRHESTTSHHLRQDTDASGLVANGVATDGLDREQPAQQDLRRGKGASPATDEQLSDSGIHPVRGLVRMVQVAPNLTVCDVGLRGVAPGRWTVSVRSTGDLSEAGKRIGPIWDSPDIASSSGHAAKGSSSPSPTQISPSTTTDGPKGLITTLEVNGSEGHGAAVVTVQWPIWEVVGRGLLAERMGASETANGSLPAYTDKNQVPRQQEDQKQTQQTNPKSIDQHADQQTEGERIMGVIARSAGLWENEKTVCACSGKTVWEERREQRARGMQ